MKSLGDLRQTIQDIWEFVVPPLINLSIITAILVFISRDLQIPQLEMKHIEGFLSEKGVFTILEALNLTATIPILGLLILLFFLNFINRIINTVGALVPIDFTCNTTFLYTQNGAFFEYWRLFPSIDDPNQLISRIENCMDQERIKETWISKAIFSLEKESSNNQARITFIKFLIFMLAYCLIHDLFSKIELFHTSRLVFGCVLLVFLLIYFYINTARQYDLKAGFYIYKAREIEISNGNLPLDWGKQKEIQELQKKYNFYLRDEGKKWWWLVFSIHKFNWMKYISNYKFNKSKLFPLKLRDLMRYFR